MKRQIQLLLLILLGHCSSVWSCTDSLKMFRQSIYFVDANGNPGDLCALSDRYLAAKSKLASLNINADRIADVRAPRFIKLTTWNRHNGFLGFGNYDPRFLYDRPGQPRGSVWSGWDSAATIVDTRAQQLANQALRGQALPFTEFNLNWFQNLHQQALGQAEASIAGRYRANPVFGSAFYKASAISSIAAQAIQQSSYPSLLLSNGQQKNNSSIVTWTRTVCFEDLPAETRRNIRGSAQEGRSIRIELLPKLDASDVSEPTQCGYFTYAPVEEIPPQLSALEANIILLMRTHLAGQSSHHEFDPVYIAARAQRWYVSIHPFNGGNGRTSRFLMDYILQRVGLPAPVFQDMDQDIMTTEGQWARLVGDGMLHVVEKLEACTVEPQAEQCKEVRR